MMSGARLPALLKLRRPGAEHSGFVRLRFAAPRLRRDMPADGGAVAARLRSASSRRADVLGQV